MPRARTLKYEFFRNESLGYMPPHARLLFAGLWCLADREGRLEDRPGRIKGYLFGCDNDVTPDIVDSFLALLDDADLIRRYHVDGVGYISIVKWSTHQHPHPREVASVIPPPTKDRSRHGHGKTSAMNGHDPGKAEDMPSPSLSSLSSLSSMPSGLTPLRSTLTPEHRVEPREKKTSRGARLPDDWRLPMPWGEWAMRDCGFVREQVERMAATFADHWHAVPGQKGLKLDWLATWRNWCRREVDMGAVRAGSRGARLREDRRRTAEAFAVGPRPRDVFDLPPEDCHVVVPKH